MAPEGDVELGAASLRPVPETVKRALRRPFRAIIGAGPTRTLSALDPAQVSHTFTIAALGINVPIAPHARVTFTIHTGAAGSYAWRCMDPCGAGPAGWGTAMSARRGYMEGTLIVTD